MEDLKRAWPKIAKKAAGKNLCVFLDFDGTLAPIALTPESAELPRETRSFLEALAARPQKVKVAVISGRSLHDVRQKVGVPGIIYSGNHGFELEGPKMRFATSLMKEYARLMRKIERELERSVARIDGVRIENKGVSVSVHYRQVAIDRRGEVSAAAQEVLRPYAEKGNVRVRGGKMVVEVVPGKGWDKGRIVLWLLSREVFAADGREPAVFYFGDDETDEDAFAALHGKGVTVLVGERAATHANYYLRTPQDMVWVLRELLELSGGAGHGANRG